MYITENGTPLTEDTAERSEWITGYLEQVRLPPPTPHLSHTHQLMQAWVEDMQWGDWVQDVAAVQAFMAWGWVRGGGVEDGLDKG